MGRGKKAITIQDVARTAGVSVSTVSRVLNDKDDVAPETYEKVRYVIRDMSYTSSLAARSMRMMRHVRNEDSLAVTLDMGTSCRRFGAGRNPRCRDFPPATVKTQKRVAAVPDSRSNLSPVPA